MKRANIELILEWLDALRRRDADGVGGVFADDIVWQGLHDDTVCRGRDSVVEGFMNARDQERDVDSLELIAAPDHVVLGIRSRDLDEVAGVAVGGEFYNVFTLSAGTIVRIDDYVDRDGALAAANLAK